MKKTELNKLILKTIKDSKEMEVSIGVILTNNQLKRDKLITDLEIIRLN
jgi:hypothetical protein